MKAKKILDYISISELSELFEYHPKTGVVTYRKGTKNKNVGDGVGWMSDFGYLRFYVAGKVFPVHRLAWLLFYSEEPENMVDHINGNRSDNRIENLRKANHSQNSLNSKICNRNSSGCKGVTWKKETNKWSVSGKISGKRIHIGYFNKLDDAKEAYCEFARKHYGEFHRSE